MNNQPQRLRFNLGQNVDVRDTKNKWVNGEIVYIKGHEAYLHYSGWSSRYDEYIDLRSDRILPQWEPSKEILPNNRIDAYHPTSGWLEARAVEIEADSDGKGPGRVKVHYFNYHPKYDRWVPFNDPNHMAMIGSRSKAYGVGKSRLNKKSEAMTLSEIAKKILELKVVKMKEELSQEDYVVKNIEGDGNCLFRSISDQLYGTEQYHKEIRQLCLKYILDEKVFFQDYVTEDLLDYVKRKSQDGTWGDDVEIEALSEIYGRPIEIYSTSAKPLRTFHEDNEREVEPVRLAYVGFCHYNSIKKKDLVNSGLLDNPFGQFQTIFSAGYSQNPNNLNLSRYREFFSHSNAIDYALSENVEAEERKEDDLAQRLQEFQSKQVSMAIEMSETENILEQIQKSEMQQIQNKLEKEQLEEEMRRIEEREMEIARQLSKKARKEGEFTRPDWFNGLLSQGYSENEVLFAIEINGYDSELVQNFLLDNS